MEMAGWFTTRYSQSQISIRIKSKNKFLNNLNNLYFSDAASDIRDFLFEVKINSKKVFLDFCYRLMEITIKKSIELGGLHRSFWAEQGGAEKPIPEARAQAIIYNHLRFLAEIKGIRLFRETNASDGSLDFHFSYNRNCDVMSVCVELKNAHHAKLEHGIQVQLPLYIEDVGSREGIFLVLWYKSSEFDEPKRFNNITEMESALISRVPKKYRIKPLIIDCAKKISPSKPAADKRLR